jgi:protein-disulfide isomerase
MSNEKTVTLKKSDLWKYSTFLLVAILVIGGILVFMNKGNSVDTAPNAVAGDLENAGNSVIAAGTDLLKTIQDNPDLFPAIGPDNTEITVTEFMDFQCPYCGIASGLVLWGDQAKIQYGDLYGSAQKTKELAKQGKIRFVAGIMSFLGQESVYAAQAGYCANQQGKFWEMHDAVYGASTSPGENDGRYNKDKLVIIAQGVGGLDQAKFKDCLENDKTLADAKKSAQITNQFAQGTPTFYVNNQQVQSSWPSIQSAIGA